MNAQEAMMRLSGTLITEGQDRYRLTGGKMILFIRLLGAQTSIRFAARDRLGLRIDASNLTIEDVKSHAIRNTFRWDQIESVAAGELESDNSDLFQG